MSAARRTPEPPMEHDQEVLPEQMGTDIPVTFPSAHPIGGNGLTLPRLGDSFLCRHCNTPLIAHDHGSSWHVPEGYPAGQRTAGVHADVEDHRARNALDDTRYRR